jgi:hypothetical protein
MKWLNVYRIRLVSVGFIAAIVLGCVELANGATITVGPELGCDFDTIQAGINAASDGDTVLVASGEYVIIEPITFRGKAITVQSETGQDETTIRMGTPADTNRGSVVVFENNETAASVLIGFTITGGKGGFYFPSANAFGAGGIFFNASSGTVRDCAIVQNSTEYGGGVTCAYACSPTLINCSIAENSAAKDGGGVHVVFEASLTLTNCTIRGNSAKATAFPTGLGGGLCCYENSLLTMINCTITANSAGFSSGGVFCGPTSSVTMTHCTITSNTSQRWSGAMECAHGSAILTNCLIARNTATSGCGGVACAWTDGSMTISNCSIWGNKAGQSSGGIAIWQGSTATVTNSIIWGNEAPNGHEISVEDPGSTLTIAYSNLAGGQAEVPLQGNSILNWGEGNIDADPCFADTDEDDFYLKSQAGRWDPKSQTWVQDTVTSSCIDAGDPMSPIGWEPFPNGGFVNMGAYGYTLEASKSYFGEPICETIVAGDINGDGQVNRTDLEIMALHWTDDEPLSLP